MSIKKISKDQPENFQFNEKSLEVAKKIISSHHPKYSKREYIKVMRDLSNIEIKNYNL